MFKSFRTKWAGPSGDPREVNYASDPNLEKLEQIRQEIINLKSSIGELSAAVDTGFSAVNSNLLSIKLYNQQIADNTTCACSALQMTNGLINVSNELLSIIANQPDPPYVPVFDFAVDGDIMPVTGVITPGQLYQIATLRSTLNGINIPVSSVTAYVDMGDDIVSLDADTDFDWEYNMSTGAFSILFFKLPPFSGDSLIHFSLSQGFVGSSYLSFVLPVEWPVDHILKYFTQMFASYILDSKLLNGTDTGGLDDPTWCPFAVNLNYSFLVENKRPFLLVPRFRGVSIADSILPTVSFVPDSSDRLYGMIWGSEGDLGTGDSLTLPLYVFSDTMYICDFYPLVGSRDYNFDFVFSIHRDGESFKNLFFNPSKLPVNIPVKFRCCFDMGVSRVGTVESSVPATFSDRAPGVVDSNFN